jgi:hypothetical protein
VAADTLLEQPGTVELVGRAQAQNTNNNGLAAYHLRVSDTGAWSILRSDLSWNLTTVASGSGPALGTNTWHRLALAFEGTTISASVDGKALGSAVTDSTYGSGPAGLGVGGYYGAQFANFSVTPGTTTALSGTYELVNHNSNDLIDASGGATTDGTPIVQWPNNSGANQKWTIAVNSDGYYSIIGASSGKALDVPNVSPVSGTPLELWTPNGGTNQQWSITPAGGGYFTMENRASGFLLDVNGASTAQGAHVIQWPANGGTNQQWNLVKVG